MKGVPILDSDVSVLHKTFMKSLFLWSYTENERVKGDKGVSTR